MTNQEILSEALSLLQQLIAIPSVSRDEAAAADLLKKVISSYGLHPQRKGNNVWVISDKWDDTKDIILLNAHIDTVKPVSTWTRDPFSPVIEEGRLYGLGCNDCGGGLVTLLQVFRELTSRPEQRYNFVYLASCEEEVSGIGGIRSVISDSPLSSLFSKSSGITAIVGEPTGMQPAIAERGLMVLDGIHEALDDLLFIRDYHFEKTSPLLGDTKMQCTVINSGTQHNVVPDECRFIVDVRTNEHYTNEEVLEFLQGKLKSTLTARSTHLRSSHIAESHPLVQKCIAMGMTPFGSPTLSDQALMPIPSFKLGPGQSSRSHSADEYICISEINDAIEKYLYLLS